VNIKISVLTAALALAAVGNAAAIDVRGALGAGTNAAKGLALSDEDVIKQADQACREYDRLNPVAAASDPYAQRLAKLTKGLENEDGLNLTFKVYKVSDVNAFAMANGCVRVFAGLMDVATDEEIRGVIGHEIGHAKLGHSKAKMKTALLTRAGREGLAASDSKAGNLAASELGGLAEDVINAQFSQKEESAADTYAYHFMVRHKFDPNALVSIFSKLGGKGGLMSSHPSSPKRVKAIQSLIAKGK